MNENDKSGGFVASFAMPSTFNDDVWKKKATIYTPSFRILETPKRKRHNQHNNSGGNPYGERKLDLGGYRPRRRSRHIEKEKELSLKLEKEKLKIQHTAQASPQISHQGGATSVSINVHLIQSTINNNDGEYGVGTENLSDRAVFLRHHKAVWKMVNGHDPMYIFPKEMRCPKCNKPKMTSGPIGGSSSSSSSSNNPNKSNKSGNSNTSNDRNKNPSGSMSGINFAQCKCPPHSTPTNSSNDHTNNNSTATTINSTTDISPNDTLKATHNTNGVPVIHGVKDENDQARANNNDKDSETDTYTPPDTAPYNLIDDRSIHQPIQFNYKNLPRADSQGSIAPWARPKQNIYVLNNDTTGTSRSVKAKHSTSSESKNGVGEEGEETEDSSDDDGDSVVSSVSSVSSRNSKRSQRSTKSNRSTKSTSRPAKKARRSSSSSTTSAGGKARAGGSKKGSGAASSSSSNNNNRNSDNNLNNQRHRKKKAQAQAQAQALARKRTAAGQSQRQSTDEESDSDDTAEVTSSSEESDEGDVAAAAAAASAAHERKRQDAKVKAVAAGRKSTALREKIALMYKQMMLLKSKKRQELSR